MLNFPAAGRRHSTNVAIGMIAFLECTLLACHSVHHQLSTTSTDNSNPFFVLVADARAAIAAALVGQRDITQLAEVVTFLQYCCAMLRNGTGVAADLLPAMVEMYYGCATLSVALHRHPEVPGQLIQFMAGLPPSIGQLHIRIQHHVSTIRSYANHVRFPPVVATLFPYVFIAPRDWRFLDQSSVLPSLSYVDDANDWFPADAPGAPAIASVILAATERSSYAPSTRYSPSNGSSHTARTPSVRHELPAAIRRHHD
jgi:hypothetical protein